MGFLCKIDHTLLCNRGLYNESGVKPMPLDLRCANISSAMESLGLNPGFWYMTC